MQIEQHRVGAVVVLEVSGELDLVGAPGLAVRVDALRQDGRPARVLVDLDGLVFCDSTGLRALIGAAGEVRAAGGRLAVSVGHARNVGRVLDITGATEYLEVHADAEAALAALS
jgi:anti-sigma B factor antagonist